MAYYITQDAHDAVWLAALEGMHDQREAGGSLLAAGRGADTVVVYALPTGPAAAQSYSHLRTDADFQNAAIARVLHRVPQLAYVGDWHVHPPEARELSTTDRETARSILQDPRMGLDELVLVLGVPGRDGTATVRMFRAKLWGQGLWLSPVRATVVPVDAPEVTRLLGEAPPDLDDLLARESEPTLPDTADLELLQRIADDLDTLRRAPDTDARIIAAGPVLGATVRRGRHHAVLVFPPEYPFGAPHVLRGRLDHGQLVPQELRFGWSSLHRLSDVLDAALAAPRAPLGARPRGLLCVWRRWRNRRQPWREVTP